MGLRSADIEVYSMKLTALLAVWYLLIIIAHGVIPSVWALWIIFTVAVL